MRKKMDAKISSKKPKRTPKNAARSAHGQRIHNASCEPPTPVVPTLSSNNPNVRTRSAARREAAIMTAIPIRSARAPSASPQVSSNSKKEIEKKKSVRFALEEDNVVADVNTTTKDKPNPSFDNPINPATTSTSSSTTLTPQRPRPLSAPHILDQLLARNPDYGATHARLRLPSVAPRLLLRPLFADARSGKFSEAAKLSPNEEDEGEQEAGEKAMMQEKQQPKKIDKKEKSKLLRKMVARIVHDTRDGRDELANAGYFLQVLEEVERSRGGSDDTTGATTACDSEGVEGAMPWLVGEVFKMLVILVSWHRQLAPREEGEDAGCVLSVRQVLELVEGEVEAAARIVHGAV